MFRTITAIILLVAFAAQTFNRSAIILDYYTNQADFIKNCENKAKPIMRCKGKCQMMKKLEQEEKKDQQNPERKIENRNEITLSSKSFFASVSLPAIELTASIKISPHSDDAVVGCSFDIFHPPQA